MSTQSQTMAIAIYADDMTFEETTANLRVQFYQKHDEKLEAVPAVLCTELYAEQLAEE